MNFNRNVLRTTLLLTFAAASVALAPAAGAAQSDDTHTQAAQEQQQQQPAPPAATQDPSAVRDPADARPDRWHGLTLDQSTPEDAVRILGKPSGDETDRVRIHGVDVWITPRHKQKIFRRLTYRNVEEAKKVELSFLDGKLAMVALAYDTNKRTAGSLGDTCGSDFVLVERIPKGTRPADYEGQKESTIPKVYPTLYGMLTVSPSSIVVAGVQNASLTASLKDLTRKPTRQLFPGSVIIMEIISRRLEKTDAERAAAAKP